MSLQGARLVHCAISLENIRVRTSLGIAVLENYSQFSENHGLIIEHYSESIDHSFLEYGALLTGESKGFESSLTVNSLLRVRSFRLQF